MKKLLLEIQDTLDWVRNFFATYFWLGTILILLNIILDLEYKADTRAYWLSIVIKLIEAVGISILIASIFTFASGTSDFIGKIRNLLEDIIVRRSFLANIDPDGKKEALKALIQPSASEINKYPNIGDYYGYFIEKTLSIAAKSVRSNYQVTCRAYFDPVKGKMAVEGIYSYRLYPSSDGFNDITVGFEHKESRCEYVAISNPSGEKKEEKDLELKEHNEGEDISFRTAIPVKDFGNGNNHLDVELKVIEYGEDHWKMIQFKALQPTDGFKFQLRCEGAVAVKEHAIFVVGAKYYLRQSDSGDFFSVACNQWVNEGTGLCVLVSLPHVESHIVAPSSEESKIVVSDSVGSSPLEPPLC